MRGGEPEAASGAIPAIRPSEHTAAASEWFIHRSLVRRPSPDIHGSDTVWGNRVTDLLRWGSDLFPENRSFRAVAKSSLNLSRSAFDAAIGGGLAAARSTRAFAVARPWGAAACAATVLILGASTYSAIGYLHYRHVASTERVAAQRAERANADLQDALDRMRNELATAQSQIDRLGEEAKRQAALSEQGKADRVAQLTRALETAQHDLHLADAQRATLTARLSKEATDLADGQAKHSQAQSSLDQTQKKLQQLSAERDKAVGERDQFRARVNELEQKLSALSSRQAPRPVAEAAPPVLNPPSAPTPAPVAASAPAVANAAPAAEPPRQVAVVIPSAPPATQDRAEAPRAAAPVVAAVDRGAFAQIERVLASAGVDVKHMFAQLGVNRGEGGPFIPSPAGQSAAPISPEKLAALRTLIKALPVTAPLESYELGSPFGVRGDPINGHSAYHTGIDLRAPYMSPVYATAAGVVTYSGYRDDYGKVVEIDHGNGISSRYAHLHRQTVSVGQRVAGHSQIGFLGSTGRATGPHVHYEVLVNGEPQDPEKFLGLARVIAAVQR
jgi:murein DD-endopeptidase MepM/ murein hydrolase activator NlpD